MRANKPAPLLPLYSLCLLRHAADFTRAIAMATSCGLLFSLPLALIATQLNSSLNYASFFYFELLRAYVRASIAPSQVRYIGIRVCVCVCVCVFGTAGPPAAPGRLLSRLVSLASLCAVLVAISCYIIRKNIEKLLTLKSSIVQLPRNMNARGRVFYPPLEKIKRPPLRTFCCSPPAGALIYLLVVGAFAMLFPLSRPSKAQCFTWKTSNCRYS